MQPKTTGRFTHCLAALYACVAATTFAIAAQRVNAQAAVAPTAATAPAPLPEPIFWKQQLFLVPYQWPSASAPASARLVTLYISRDRGVSWQKISEGRPDLKAFNYRAEGDGEYWFAIRTLDNRGQIWPAAPYQPELRVIVDTTIPRIDELHARPTAEGTIEIQCRATDVNLNPTSLKVEAQFDTSAWQPVTLQQLSPGAPPAAGPTALPSTLASPLRAIWQPPAGTRPIAIRAAIADRAGNSTVFQTPVEAPPAVTGPQLTKSAPTAANQPLSAPVAATRNVPPVLSIPTSAASGLSSGSAAPSPPAPPANQSWSSATTASAPFQLMTSGKAATDDGKTAYGNPPVTNSALPLINTPAATTGASDENARRVPAHFAGSTAADSSKMSAAPASGPTGPQFQPLPPFRQSSASSQPVATTGPALVPVGSTSSSFAPAASMLSNNLQVPTPASADVTPVATAAPTNRPTSPPKMVGSRTFSLEYELEDSSRTGVARIELWGTRDGGQTWSRTAVDDECRSPLVVTVDDEGLYGFKILVQPANAAPITPPRAGEVPELWVSVDLKRPIVELTAIERGDGNLADHMILHWRAQDSNLEPRPIALFFCSRPTGPWQPIARNLENTGEYAWRIERFVPDRIYLRLEARDVAGNLAAFQTREPVEFGALPPAGKLRSTAPASPDPTAANTSGALR